MDDSRDDRRGSRRPPESDAAARPVSARVAKRAVAAAGRQVPRLDDDKELAIRRAIARRLKREVLSKDDDDDRWAVMYSYTVCIYWYCSTLIVKYSFTSTWLHFKVQMLLFLYSALSFTHTFLNENAILLRCYLLSSVITH